MFAAVFGVSEKMCYDETRPGGIQDGEQNRGMAAAGDMRLRNVCFYLGNEAWMREARILAGELEAAGIACVWIDGSGGLTAAEWKEDVPKAVPVTDSGENAGWASETILITDSREAAREAARRGIVCAACAGGGSFFEGAQLVVGSLAGLGPEVLGEFLLRTKGIPVTIAQTERLVIREIAEADFTRLREISMQEGMELAVRGDMQDGRGDPICGCSERKEIGGAPPGMFSDEYLSMYIKYMYRFYGYGLWSVFLRDGTLIGCCGFCNLEENVPDEGDEIRYREDRGNANAQVQPDHCQSVQACKCAGAPRRLELQYMLAREAQGEGYAQEMCRAALRFAFARTDADEVWVCVHRDNVPSVRLAERLGFTLVNGKNAGEILYYRCCADTFILDAAANR